MLDKVLPVSNDNNGPQAPQRARGTLFNYLQPRTLGTPIYVVVGDIPFIERVPA